MSRSLTIRKPQLAEVRHLLQVLEATDHPGQRRRVEAVLLYATGLNAQEIADGLDVHVNTVYADLQAFDQDGVAGVKQFGSGGAPRRVTEAQVAEIWRLAEQSPTELDLPYGRWSLAKLRDYLIKHHVLKTISREHLRRVLKKGTCVSDASSANWSAKTRVAGRS